MNPKNQEIIDAVLQLPEAEQVEIVERLLENISPDGNQQLDDLWEAELNRRASDPDPGIPWEDVKKQL